MRRLSCVAVMLAVGAGLLSLAGGQTVPASDPAASQPGAATKPVEQPAEFTALAKKAARLPGLNLKGATGMLKDEKEVAAADVARDGVEFEIWATPKTSRITVLLPKEQAVAVSDGEFAYSIAERAGQMVGYRRRITAANYYHAMPLASAAMDALNGYANLAASVRFVPDNPDRRFAGLGNLKWFRLDPVTTPRHHLLMGVRSVRVALSPVDGVIRVMLAEMEVLDKPSRDSVVLMETVKVAPIAPGELLLPARAAELKWKDMDAAQAIPPPENVIERKQ